MGTSSGYGGSGSKEWKGARERFLELVGEGGSGDTQPAAPSNPQISVDGVGSAVASALLRDEAVSQHANAGFELSDILGFGRGGHSSHGSGGQDGGSDGSGGGERSQRSTRRQVAAGAARAGAAISGAYALRSGDAAALGQLGLNMDELRGLSTAEQCERLATAVVGDGVHPDDHALKKVTIEQLKAILAAETPPTAEQTVQSFIANWIFELGVVELLTVKVKKQLSADRIIQAERQLKRWLKSKVRNLSFPSGRLSPKEFANHTARLTAQALELIRSA